MQADGSITDKDILEKLHPEIRDWFRQRHGKLAPAQKAAIPRILEGKNVLICAPTGSGKTLSAFLGILGKLTELAKKGLLEDRVYCIYISPLRAVANDIRKNLLLPLKEMGLEETIRVAVRTGDTPKKEKTGMLKHPPHILITTPESFTLLLNSVRFQENLKGVEYVILDEIHELCATKRGALLSAELEFLEELSPKFVRIGLSATQSPIVEIGKFLGGYTGNNPRKVEILNLEGAKEYDLKIIYPEGIGNKTREEGLLQIARICAEVIEKHRTVIIFTNTRKLTEEFVQVLRSLEILAIDAHHGSLSRKRRLETEDSLKRGELRAVVTSTSLELGIDIGTADCVIQISSPKSISKAIQRFGRAGHTLGGKSKGYFIPTSIQDLLECIAIIMKIQRRELDNVEIPEKPLDVLAQVVVGLGIHSTWKVREVLKILRRSYTYHNLKKKELENVLDAVTRTRRPLLYYEKKLEEFTTRKGAAGAFYENVGTIPQEHNYEVFDEFGELLGTLSERFVEFLKPGDTFVLGARVYELIRRAPNKIFVKESLDKSATIPSWVGELNARTRELSVALGDLLENLAGMDEKKMRNYLTNYFENPGGIDEVVGVLKKQAEFGIPGKKRIVSEVVGEEGKTATVVLSPNGRRVNEALARYIINKLQLNTEVMVDDNGFSLQAPASIPIEEILQPEDFERVVLWSVRTSDIFRTKFKQCASRALLLLGHRRGKKISSGRISRAADELLHSIKPGHPIYREAIKETVQMVDIPGAIQVLEGVKNGAICVSGGLKGKLSPLAIEMLSTLARDSGFLVDKLRKIKRQAGLKKYLVTPDAMKFVFENENDALNFIRQYRSYWQHEANLEKLCEEKRVHRVSLMDRTAYLSPDAHAIYAEFLALDVGSERRQGLAKMLVELLATSPFDAPEFARMLGYPLVEVEKMLDELLVEGTVVPVIYNDTEKYLNARFLEFVMGKESEYISQKEVSERVAKATLGVGSVDEYFENYLGVREPYSLFARGIITPEEWEKIVAEEKVLYGRFLGGRCAFVRCSDIPLIQSFYSMPLSENELKVLKLVQSPVGFTELRKNSGLSSRMLREILDKLEALVLVRREWGEPLKYVALPRTEQNEANEEELIFRLVRGFGAVSVETLSRYLNLPYERIHAIASNLHAKNKVKRAKIIGTERIIFMAEQTAEKKIPETILLPVTDPCLETRWAEISGRHGDVNLVYVENNELVALMNAETKEGAIEVHEIHLATTGSPDKLGKWLKHYANYKRALVVRINRAHGSGFTLPGDFFESRGKWLYSAVDYFPGFFPFEDLFPKLLTLQKIYRKLEHTSELAQALFGVHNLEEAKLRAKFPVPPEEIKGLYYAHGLPSNAYMSIAQLSTVRAIKNPPLTPEMQEVLACMEDCKDEEELYAAVSLSYRKFRKTLNQMLKHNLIYEGENGKLKVVPEADHEKATLEYIEHLIASFGLVNPAFISGYTRNLIGKAEALDVCTRLALEGKCRVGFALKETDALFYIKPDILETDDCDFTGVISAEDRIVKFFSPVLKKLSGFSNPYIIVSSGKIAGFALAKKKGKVIHLEDFAGDENAWQIFREFLFSRDYALRK
ncbi:MAG: DEAD/DEAH box helicase [Thermoplasmata archaeon]|nr:DEAD/DEAH box helicase [Thermoplasmata archaeon]